MICYGERLEVEGERGEDGVVLPTNLLSLRRSPRQSTVPNGDRHLTTPIRLKATISSLPPPLPKVAQGTCSSSSPPFSRPMTALPSFVELMASLGLDNKKSSSTSTQEFSSPAIVVSSEHEPTQEHISSRIRVARYSPYGAPIVSVTVPLDRTAHPYNVLSSPIPTEGVLLRSLTMEPNQNSPIGYAFVIFKKCFHRANARSQSNPTSPRHRPSALKLGPESRHRHVNDPESAANMPISTFLRRKTPTSSPVSPTFAHRTRKRSQSPTINPVSIPTLPPVFVSQVQQRDGRSSASPSPSESDDENILVHRHASRLTPEYSFPEDRHISTSPFSRNNLVQDTTSRCVSPLA